MKRARMTVIQDPVFNIPVVCVWDTTDRQFCALLKKKFDIEVENMLDHGGGVFFAHECQQGTLAIVGLSEPFTGTPADYAILSHELLHCVFHMLKDRGLPYTGKTEEAYAYLHSFLLSTLAEEMLNVEAKLERRREARGGR